MLFAFAAEAEGELSVETGQLVRVLFADGTKYEQDGWLTVYGSSGAVGLVPDAYLEVEP